MGFLSQRWGCALGSVTQRGHLEPPLDRLIQRAIVREHVSGEPATLVAVHRPEERPGLGGAGAVTVILMFEAF